MSAPARPTEPDSDSLQPIRDSLQRRPTEAAEEAERCARRQRLDERLAGRFQELVSLACRMLARADCSRSADFLADLAHRLLAFNQTLIDADQEYPRYRILERLQRAKRAGVPALVTAASLLLLDPAADVESLVHDLEAIRCSPPNDDWPMWLTYVLDQLINSHRPPVKDNVPPDTTREDWRKAELAFGCILLSDASFRVLQEAIDQAACQVDDALICGGSGVRNRPPARVRDLIARFDHRALDWYGSESPPPRLLQPPPSIEAIAKPAALRRRLDEVWTAANSLLIALDRWAGWFVDLREKGDAHPAVALLCRDMARQAVKVLPTHRPNVEPFDKADETALLAMLPPTPEWWGVASLDPNGGVVGPGTDASLRRSACWQEDRHFLDRYYCSAERLQEKSGMLRAAAAELIALLRSYPATALAPQRVQAKGEEVTQSGRRIEDARDILSALLDQAESRRRHEGEARRVAADRAGRLKQQASLRERLAEAFESAYAFPNEEREHGRKPCPDGFRRWADRLLALGAVMRECDEAIGGLRLEDRLRAVAGKPSPDAMKYACALLLVAGVDQADAVRSALKDANTDIELRRFVLWLPFILDHLWMPFPREDGMTPTADPPHGTSPEDNRLAEEAFGWMPLGPPSDPLAPPVPGERIGGRTTVPEAGAVQAGGAAARPVDQGQAAPSPEAGQPPAPLTPARYLFSWREILVGLGLKNDAEWQGRVRQLNQQYDGPILLPGKGGQPKADRDKLVAWWNGLDQRFQKIEQKKADTQASVQEGHDYGRDGKVLPGISGHVQKRRRNNGGP